MAAIAVGNGKMQMLLWAIAAGSIGGGAIWWTRAVPRSLRATAEFDPPRAFLGEPVTLKLSLHNERALPLPLVRLFVPLPEGLGREGEIDPVAVGTMRGRCSIQSRGRATFEVPVRAAGRGEYWVDSAEAIASDPFGLVPVRCELRVGAALLVMPEARIAVPLSIRKRLPFGSPSPAARLFEDREYFAGVRDYEPGDPLGRVHWRLTAHTGNLQTKLFEPTRTAEVLFAIDLSGGEPFWDWVTPAIAEDAVGWTSFLVRQAIASGWRCGLVANTHLRKGRGPLRVPASTARGHEAALFAALAKMPNQPTADLAPVLHEVGRRLARRAVVVVVSARPGLRLRREINVLRRRGLSVLHVSPLEPMGAEAVG